jgi:hypothetical protein
VKDVREEVYTQLHHLASREILKIREESQQPDWRAFDEIAFDMLELNSERRNGIYEELRRLVEMVRVKNRLVKAGSV